jgi:uncharacterized damage-inducible protein DinB
MAVAAALLPEFDHEMAGCRRTLERVPGDRFGFRPHPKSMTLGRLANHLASVPAWLVQAMESTQRRFVDPEDATRAPLAAETPEAVLDLFDRSVRAARAALAGASDADLEDPWTGRSHDGRELFTLPRRVVYQRFILDHMIHHRAQLTVYLRLLDLPVPALYGPTADEG